MGAGSSAGGAAAFDIPLDLDELGPDAVDSIILQAILTYPGFNFIEGDDDHDRARRIVALMRSRGLRPITSAELVDMIQEGRTIAFWRRLEVPQGCVAMPQTHDQSTCSTVSIQSEMPSRPTPSPEAFQPPESLMDFYVDGSHLRNQAVQWEQARLQSYYPNSGPSNTGRPPAARQLPGAQRSVKEAPELGIAFHHNVPSNPRQGWNNGPEKFVSIAAASSAASPTMKWGGSGGGAFSAVRKYAMREPASLRQHNDYEEEMEERMSDHLSPTSASARASVRSIETWRRTVEESEIDEGGVDPLGDIEKYRRELSIRNQQLSSNSHYHQRATFVSEPQFGTLPGYSTPPPSQPNEDRFPRNNFGAEDAKRPRIQAEREYQDNRNK